MENTKTFLAVEGDELIDHENQPYTATLKSEQLITATLEHWKVEYAATELDPMCTDPFQHCFICAETERKNLSNGKLLKFLLHEPITY